MLRLQTPLQAEIDTACRSKKYHDLFSVELEYESLVDADEMHTTASAALSSLPAGACNATSSRGGLQGASIAGSCSADRESEANSTPSVIGGGSRKRSDNAQSCDGGVISGQAQVILKPQSGWLIKQGGFIRNWKRRCALKV
jgi:hypothetical protein